LEFRFTMFPQRTAIGRFDPDARSGTRRRVALGWIRRSTVLLAACLLVSCASSVRTSATDAGPAATVDAPAAGLYVGEWAYGQSCGWQHSAHLRLRIADDGGIVGDWSDGTRVRGEHGELRGELRGDRLFMRFCREAVGEYACPRFGPVDSYLQRRGETVVWYRAYGTTHREYLTLHASIPGRPVPQDNRCPEED
jgi:hypothetical protein